MRHERTTLKARERRELRTLERHLLRDAPDLAHLLHAWRPDGLGTAHWQWLLTYAAALVGLSGAALGDASLLVDSLVLAGTATTWWATTREVGGHDQAGRDPFEESR